METGSSGDSDSEYEARVSSGTEEDEGNITTADGIADGSIFKKRKRNRVKFDSRTEQSVKRIKAAYSADYLDVFNQTLQGAVAGIHEDDWPFHDPSQIGMTYWSSAEKERFFLALERYGRCNLSAVVQAVRSKSSLQVEEYIQLLARGSVEYETKQRKNALVRTIDIPAAVELTQETCHALEQSADALGLLIKEDDSLKEQNRYGEDWLITEQSCLSATQPLNDLSQLHETASPKDQLDLALTLFDVPQIIQLSSHVFMNSPDQSYSWPALALPGESPSIFATALIDFRTLVIHTTKRVVSATLFNAMARIRAADTLAITKGTRPPNPVVRKDDVLVALDNLALAHDSAAFWRDAPRRLGLSVHETHPGKPYSYNRRDERTNTFSAISKAPALSLDEAEILLSPFAEDPDLGEALSVKQSIEKPLFDLVLEEPSHQTSSPTSTRRLSSPISDSDVSIDSNSDSDGGDPEEDEKDEEEVEETNYLEAVDMRQSCEEEARLLALLPNHLTSGIVPTTTKLLTTNSPPEPRRTRKTLQDFTLEAWRTHATKTYIPEWERHGHLLPATAFAATNRTSTSHQSGVRQIRQPLPPLTRADFKGRTWRGRSRSQSRARSASVGAASEDSEAERGRAMRAQASRSGTPAAPSGGLRRSSRSASKGRVDYSMHGLGARDPFAFGPLDDGNSSDGAGGKVDGMDVDVDVG